MEKKTLVKLIEAAASINYCDFPKISEEIYGVGEVVYTIYPDVSREGYIMIIPSWKYQSQVGRFFLGDPPKDESPWGRISSFEELISRTHKEIGVYLKEIGEALIKEEN